jgi:hypothetical protein
MNLFHKATLDVNSSHGWDTAMLVFMGIMFILLFTWGFFLFRDPIDSRTKSTVVGKGTFLSGAGAMVAFVVMMGMFLGSYDARSDNIEKAESQTVSSLQSWSQKNYGISLSKDEAVALLGHEAESDPVVVDYKDEPIAVQLVEYKNGYVLANNKVQQVPQLESQSRVDK